MKDCSIFTLYFIIFDCKYINSILKNYKAKNLSHWLLEFMSFALYLYPRNFPIMHILNIYVTTKWSIFFYRYIFTVWYKLETLQLKVKNLLRTLCPRIFFRPSCPLSHGIAQVQYSSGFNAMFHCANHSKVIVGSLI